MSFLSKTAQQSRGTVSSRLRETHGPLRQLDEDTTFAASADACVLITVDRDVDAEWIARLIHQRSSRRHGPFEILSGAELSEPAFEFQLLGDSQASPARNERGLFEKAEGGTVLVAGLGTLSAAKQSILLEVLDRFCAQPAATARNHARIIGAADTALLGRVACKEFSDRLFYRLNVIHVVVPSGTQLVTAPGPEVIRKEKRAAKSAPRTSASSRQAPRVSARSR